MENLKIKNIFSDIPMFLSKNSFTGDINLRKDLTCIRDSIKNIVLTNIGERAFDYNFGGGLRSLLFENINGVELYAFRIQLANMIKMYDPRISMTHIDIRTLDKTSVYPVIANYVEITLKYDIVSLDLKDEITVQLQRSR